MLEQIIQNQEQLKIAVEASKPAIEVGKSYLPLIGTVITGAFTLAGAFIMTRRKGKKNGARGCKK